MRGGKLEEEEQENRKEGRERVRSGFERERTRNQKEERGINGKGKEESRLREGKGILLK